MAAEGNSLALMKGRERAVKRGMGTLHQDAGRRAVTRNKMNLYE